MRVATIPSLIAAGAVALALGGPELRAGKAAAASFNCAQAATRTERAICGDSGLSAMDSAIGAAYQQRLALDSGLRQIQRGWLKARDIGCVADRGCLRRFMVAELGMLQSGERPPNRVPIVPGACALSTVTLVGPRLENAPGSGSEVQEAIGVTQVSYDAVPQMDSSRVGDPVLVCLVSLPTHCPPGDDRGKFYSATNLRTLGAWSDPDSEHMCGGA